MPGPEVCCLRAHQQNADMEHLPQALLTSGVLYCTCRNVSRSQNLLSEAHALDRKNSMGDGTHLSILPSSPLSAAAGLQNGDHSASPAHEPNGFLHTHSPTHHTAAHTNGYTAHEHYELSQTPFPGMTSLALRADDAAVAALEPAAIELSEAPTALDPKSPVLPASLKPGGSGHLQNGASQNGVSQQFANVALDPSGSPSKQIGKTPQELSTSDGKLVEVCLLMSCSACREHAGMGRHVSSWAQGACMEYVLALASPGEPSPKFCWFHRPWHSQTSAWEASRRNST